MQPVIGDPCLDAIMISDPRAPGKDVPLVAFYFPGEEEACDRLCRSAFLGNFYDLGPGALELQPPNGQLHGSRTRSFRNAEAAFQALKFWSYSDQFSNLTGEEAFRKSRETWALPDSTYCGYGSNWKAMRAVLEAKFKPGAPCTEALLKTKDAFLLEHNSVSGRDTVWSDDKYGRGKNWLGLLLMLVRDGLAQFPSWTRYLCDALDLSTGNYWYLSGDQWQRAVRQASQAAVAKVQEAEEQPQMKRHQSVGPASGADDGQRQASPSAASVGAPQRCVDTAQLLRWEDVPCISSSNGVFKDPLEWPGGRLQRSDLVPRATRSETASKTVALVHGSIADVQVDVIVNPVYERSEYSALSRAIHSAAGPALLCECKRAGDPEAGKPVLTGGHRLKASHVLHVDAPSRRDNAALRACYWTALDGVSQAGLRSVALPCIAQGLFTVRDATLIGLRTVRRWLDAHPDRLECVAFVLFHKSDHEIYAKLLPVHFPRSGDYAMPEDSLSECVIEFVWADGGDSVMLAGEFNNWGQAPRIPMDKDADGLFRMAWKLAKGRTYMYKFIVDGWWRCRADQPTEDHMGNQNNVIHLPWGGP